MEINVMRDAAYTQAQASGFWDVAVEDLYRAALYAKLHMIISQAMEAGRRGDGEEERRHLFDSLGVIYALEGENTYYSPAVKDNAAVLARIALIISELGEGCENYFYDLGENNLDEELGDVLIRCGDIAGGLGIDLEGAVEKKMARNRSRPKLHGKSF